MASWSRSKASLSPGATSSDRGSSQATARDDALTMDRCARARRLRPTGGRLAAVTDGGAADHDGDCRLPPWWAAGVASREALGRRRAQLTRPEARRRGTRTHQTARGHSWGLGDARRGDDHGEAADLTGGAGRDASDAVAPAAAGRRRR